jgi:hypothetical protein
MNKVQKALFLLSSLFVVTMFNVVNISRKGRVGGGKCIGQKYYKTSLVATPVANIINFLWP